MLTTNANGSDLKDRNGHGFSAARQILAGAGPRPHEEGWGRDFRHSMILRIARIAEMFIGFTLAIIFVKTALGFA